MEPFELALSQVNFEGNDLNAGPAGGQPLHSFSNLVSYDSDFKDGAGGQPVAARRLLSTHGDGLPGEDTLASSFYLPYTGAHNGGPHAHAHLVNGSDSVSVEPDATARIYYNPGEMESQDSSSSSNSTPRRRSEKVKDSFTGFTETVEALALQKSVIGNSNITPASADEIARAIAMTQQKMQPVQEDSSQHTLTPTVEPHGAEQNIDVQASYDVEASTSSIECSPVHAVSVTSATAMPKLDAPVPMSHGLHVGSTLGTMTGDGVTVLPEEPDAATAASRDDEASTNSSSSHHRTASTSSSELIPVPQEMITKVTERTGGWLSGRSVVSPEQSRPRASHNEVNNPNHVTSDTAEKDLDSIPGEQSSEPKAVPGAGVAATVQGGAESTSVITVAEQNLTDDGSYGNMQGLNVEENISHGTDMNGVQKLKDEYDFDTSSYLETMQTFTSLQKTSTGVLEEETGTARFSPPVKDPGMLLTDKRLQRGNNKSVDEVTQEKNAEEEQESIQILPDEKLVIPFHPPVDTSTPVRPTQCNQLEEQQQKELVATSAKRQVIIEEVARKTETITRVARQSVGPEMDQDITDETQGVNDLLSEQLTAMKVTHTLNRGPNATTEESSMMANVDEMSQAYGRLDDMTGDLSLGNSSAAAGEGADLTKSERAELYRLQEEVGKLRREKAHLEGKLEVVESEAATAIKERSELQSHLASVSTHLRSQENNTKTVMGDRNALAADLETLKQNRQRLELVVMDAQKLIEEKDQDLKTLSEDLKLAHAANERTNEKVKEHRHEVLARDETIQALKNKVAELYVQYQNSQQTGLLAENQIKSLESSVASLTSAKEWYQGQLARSQDAKGELQQEISRIQGESIAALTLVERLKADNVRVKQALAEQQQRALQEKELLARHLEAIESDMMERETAFQQLQQEQLAMEHSMKHNEERLKQSDNQEGISEEIKKLQNDLRRKQAQVNVLEHEQSQLVKRLTLSQESLLERDRTIDRLDQKYVDIELSYKNLQHELDNRDEEVLKLKNEKNVLEIELVSTKEEKETFDTALHVIKDDMGRVENGFRQLKQELSSRTDELGKVRGQNQELNRQLKAARARLRVLTHQATPKEAQDHDETSSTSSSNYDLAPVHPVNRDGPQNEEGLVVKIVQKQNSVGESQPEVVIETQVCEAPPPITDSNQVIAELDNAVIGQLQAERNELERRVQELDAQAQEMQAAAARSSDLESQVMTLTQKLEAMERQHNTARDERIEIEQQLVQSRTQLEQLEQILKTLQAEKEALENTLKDERSRLEQEAASAASDVVEEREAIMQVNKENNMLRSKVTEVEKQMNKEVTKLRAKVLQVTEEYEARLDEERSRQVDYQAALSELNQRMRQSEELKEQLAVQLKESEERFNLSLDEQKLNLQEQTQKLSQERVSLEDAQRKVQVELEDVRALLLVREETIEILRTKIGEIEVQHREAKEQLEESERLRQEEDARRLSLDLEREKGRLAGVVKSHTALKEHTTSLEAALARREASVAGLSTHVQGELQKRDKHVHDMKEQLRELEVELAKEKQNVKDTKKQLMTEKGQHIKLRRQMETLWVDQDQVKVDLQTRTNQLNLTTLDLEKVKHSNKVLKADIERLTIESHTTRTELEQLRRDVLEREQQDPLLKEQIQTLQWQLQQRTLELDALREQLNLTEERQKVEVESLNRALQTANNELMSAREELMALRQDKLALTTKVAQIKSAVKATASQNKKMLEQKEAEISKTLPFDMEALERLLVDTAPVAVKSKPLSFLKATLSGLRGEISNLQQQVDQHTSAVQTSSQAWKELEGHVKELREVTQTSAAGRAATNGGEEQVHTEPSGATPEGAQSTLKNPESTPILDV